MLTYAGRRKATPNGQGANLSYNTTAEDLNLSLTEGLLIAQVRRNLATAAATASTGATAAEKECSDAAGDAAGDRATDARKKNSCAEENVFSAPAARDSVHCSVASGRQTAGKKDIAELSVKQIIQVCWRMLTYADVC